MVIAEEKIYISGGEIGLGRGKWNEHIYMLDTVKRSIDIVGRMPEKRRHHKSCCTSQALYIAAGNDKFRCKRQEVFKLDIHSGKCPDVPIVSTCTQNAHMYI